MGGAASATDLPSPSSVRLPVSLEPEATACVEREVAGEPESTSPPHARLPEPSEPESELSVEPSSAARVEMKAEVQAPSKSTEAAEAEGVSISPASQAPAAAA